MAPFIRLTVEGQEGGRPALVAEDGMFGLQPECAAEEQYGRRTYNARSETVHRLPSFRPAWETQQRCIIPTEAVFEPSYESGKAVRWRISQDGDVPFGIVGIYRRWRDPKGGPPIFAFAMLTVNADTRPFYKRFHKPGEEKRMPIFLGAGRVRAMADLCARRGAVVLQAAPRAFPRRGCAAYARIEGHRRAEVEGRTAATEAPPPPPQAQGDLF